MTIFPRIGIFRSSPLPPHFGMVAVDAMGSTRLPSIQQAPLSQTIAEVVQRALVSAGLGGVSREFETNTGDGLSFGCDPTWVPFLVSPFADELNAHLLRHNAGSRSPVRLRMSIHIGPVPLAPGAPRDGNAASRSENHRLLDSEPVRRCLRETDAQAPEEAQRAASTVPAEAGSPPTRHQHVESGVAVMDCAVRDIHHHMAPRQDPGHS